MFCDLDMLVKFREGLIIHKRASTVDSYVT